jgi:dTDP-4-amino-4,6-dideoxygalactose transaminase
VPAVTFVSTASSVLFVGAVPVIVDVSPDGYTIDIEQARAAITQRTRAIMPVHFGNQMADMDGVQALAKEFGLRVIEDAAHAHGCKWRNKGAGSWGDFGSFSFQTNKLMTAGEGGILITSDETLAERIEILASCGHPSSAHKHGFRSVGTNARMTEFQAGILYCQMQRLDDQVTVRERNAQLLGELLAGAPALIPPKKDARLTRQSHYRFLMNWDETAAGGVTRDQFAAAVAAEGVFCKDIYVPLHRTPQFHLRAELFPQVASRLSEYRDLQCPQAERTLKGLLAMPHPFLLGTERRVRAIAGAFTKVLDNLDEVRQVMAARPEHAVSA